MQERRYNKTALERLRTARDHVYYAAKSLDYGILENDFKAEITELDNIFRKICKTWNAETYGMGKV